MTYLESLIKSLRTYKSLENSEASLILEELSEIYAEGYKAGHNDTVEGQYIDVLPCDRNTFFAEEVNQLIEEILEARKE